MGRKPAFGASDGLADLARAQRDLLLSVIVSKRKMFSGVILMSAPKEREWNL
jgi:hypothetical protein